MTPPDTFDQIAANAPALLSTLNRRQADMRDHVRAVPSEYATGLYLFGRPGTAKTHTVRSVLEGEVCQPYVYQRGHLTPVGLFELLHDHPDEVIVLDDLVTIFRSDVALQILLSALEHPTARDRSRVVKYKRKGETVRVAFRGGIICITNRVLHDADLLGAFKSRVHVLNYDPSDAQLGALMLSLADRGWPADHPSVTPAEAREVARHLIGELLRVRPAAVPEQGAARLPAMEGRGGGVGLAGSGDGLGGGAPAGLSRRGCPPVAGRPQGRGARRPPDDPGRTPAPRAAVAGLGAGDGQVGAGVLSAAGRAALTVFGSVNVSKCQQHPNGGPIMPDDLTRWLGMHPASLPDQPVSTRPPSEAIRALFAEQREEAVAGVRDALASGVPARTVSHEVAAYGVTPEAVHGIEMEHER